MIDKLPVPNPHPDLKIAVRAALKAGETVMQVYSGEFTSKTKEDNSPVTEADIKSNQIIKQVLETTDHCILSEEDADDPSRLDSRYVWIVDPLDGTSDFIKRTGEFTIMIALVEESTPVLGVIFCPAQKMLFVAQKNSGAFRHINNTWSRIHVTKESRLENCRAVGSRNHLSAEDKAFFDTLHLREFTSIGSSLKVAKISSGDAEIYITTTDKMKEWDSCASYCIITEAGGRMTDCLGNDLTYNNRIVNHQNGIVASNGMIHDRVTALMEKLK